jgi:ketosteroid isomerase-like protein
MKEPAEARAEIAALHMSDMAATKAGDADALVALWSEGIIALPPEGPIQRDRVQMEADLRRSLAQSAGFETLEYVQDFEEIEILGDHAWELGTFRGRVRERGTGAVTEVRGKLMRILKRDGSGAWKVHRTIWNEAGSSGSAGG